MAQAALRLVEGGQFATNEVEIWSSEAARDNHSLHYSIYYPQNMRPELPSYFIQRYSRKEEVVLDPFSRGGTTALEANLLGRVAYFSDISPLALKLSRSRVEPVEIVDVTLRIQQINMRRPINAGAFNEVFEPFYDIETFRELVNLKASLSENNDRVSRFLEHVALSLLHGQSAGYFSVYSFPQFSPGPAEQLKLNRKRGQVPDYRSVGPRLLRRAATMLRDGIPSFLRQIALYNQYSQCDARDLSWLQSSTVNLVVTAPPVPESRDPRGDNWLRLWFAGLSAKQAHGNVFDGMDSWRDYMSGVLLEMARVVKPGGRVVLCFSDAERRGLPLDQEVVSLVKSGLSRYFEAETAVVNKPRSAALPRGFEDEEGLASQNAARSSNLVLKRRS